MLSGGTGADRFIFSEDNGDDVIKDFQEGANKIELVGYDLSKFLRIDINVVNGSTVIELPDGGGTITLEDFTGIDGGDFTLISCSLREAFGTSPVTKKGAVLLHRPRVEVCSV